MYRAFGWNRNSRKSTQQLFPDLASTPAGVLLLHVQYVILHLERKLVGITIRPAAAIGKPINPKILVPIKDLVSGLPRDTKLSTKLGHRLTCQSPSHKLKPLVHNRTLLPRHHFLPREEVLPMCPVQTVTYVSGRSSPSIQSQLVSFQR